MITVGELVPVDMTLLAAFLQLVIPVKQRKSRPSKGDRVRLGSASSGRRNIPDCDSQAGVLGECRVRHGKGEPFIPLPFRPERLVRRLHGDGERLRPCPHLNCDIEVRMGADYMILIINCLGYIKKSTPWGIVGLTFD